MVSFSKQRFKKNSKAHDTYMFINHLLILYLQMKIIFKEHSNVVLDAIYIYFVTSLGVLELPYACMGCRYTVIINNTDEIPMHRSVAGYNPYNLFILTKYFRKKITSK